MIIDRVVLRFRVIKKQEKTKWLIFPKYVLTLQVADERAKTYPTMTREVPFHQFNTVGSGTIIQLGAYTRDHKTWYFSEHEARFAKL